MPTLSILLVDDDEKVRYSLGKILEKKSYRVLTAAGGQTALERLNASPVNLVLLDLNLPDIQVLSLISKIQKEYPDLPVMILTATPTHDTGAEAARLGIQGYMMKPIDPVELVGRIESVLGEHPN